MYCAHVRPEDGRKESIADHLHEVAEMASEFASVFGAETWAYAAGLAHDIGKYSDAFQHRILGGGPVVDHSTAGAYEIDELGLSALAYCIAGHHGGLPDGGTKTDEPGDPTLHGRLLKAAEGGVHPYEAFRGEIDLQKPDTPRFFAQSFKPSEECFALAFLTRMIFSCLVDADFLCTERFMSGDAREGLSAETSSELCDRLEKKLESFYPPKTPLNEVRCSILDACARAAEEAPGVFSLTVPTGGGKTYASLRFALKHAASEASSARRVIYCVPYTSIIEQNAAVFREVLGARNVLEHHANFDFDEHEDEGGVLRLATENWDAPVVVTTNVQFFESLYASKTSRCRKLHNIAGSVIVLDEAQMLPTKQLLPCVRALAELVRHYGCTVVLCTATQPSLNGLFGEYGCAVREIVADPAGLARKLKRVTYRYVPSLSDEDLAARMNGHDQVLCIVNSRRQAGIVYGLLDDEGSYHLSTLMHPVHRSRVLKEIRERLASGLTCRVVSTSLIEAGVDIDFPVAYRALAGIDSMIQASGRVNRNARASAESSLVHLFAPSEQYALPSDLEQKAAIARGILRRLGETSDPEGSIADGGSGDGEIACDIGSLEIIESYFTELYGLRRDNLDANHVLSNLSKYQSIRSIPFERAAQDFQMIEDGSVSVVVPADEIAEDIAAIRREDASRNALRRIGRYSVGAYDQDIKALLRAGAVEAVAKGMYLLLDQARYSEKTGLDCASEEGKGLFF